MRIALAHDWLCGFRGGEAVLDRIARTLREDNHDLPALLVMFDDRRPLAPNIDPLPKRVSFLSRIPAGSGPLRRWLLPLYPAAVAHLGRQLAALHRERPIDLLISTSSAAVKGLRPPPGVPHICYCHAPARYVWSQRSAYARGGRASLRSLGLMLYAGRFSRWDRRTGANVTHFIANSSHTAAEIRRCFDREATVIHPPVRTDFFTPGDDDDDDAGAPRGRHGSPPSAQPCGAASRAGQTPRPTPPARTEDWLVVSALEPYKRIDLAISAAQRARRRLIIVGAGSQEAHLRKIAFSGVEFRGRLPDEDVRDLYRTAAALIFPQIEDFGITAVEAQACGCPVMARRAGGALDSVIEGQTGAFFDDPTPTAITEAAARLPQDCARACRRNALRFAPENFDRAIRALITEMHCATEPHPGKTTEIHGDTRRKDMG